MHPLQLIVFLFVPCLFVSSVWIFTTNPSTVLTVMPSFWHRGAKYQTVQELLPPHPDTMTKAWKLGQFDGKLQLVENGSVKDLSVDQLLKDAAQVVGKETLTAQQLHKVGELLAQLEDEKGIIQRVTGMFSFINLVWLLSICGILVTIGPVLFLIARPIMAYLVIIFTDVIVPIFVALKPVYEYVFYFACFAFIVEGARFPVETGFYISLTGVLGAVPAFLYTTYLHSTGQGNKHAFAQVFNVYLGLCWVPLTQYYNSSLLGFLSVAALYSALGFSVICTGLCWVFGFGSDNTLYRVVVTSSLLVSTFTLLKAFGVKTPLLVPFASGIVVMGSLTYFLGLLIVSSNWSYHTNRNYMKMQLMMIGSLVIAIFMGNVFNIPSLTNTALTFTGLYAGEKTTEVRVLWKGAMLPVTFFAASVLLYFLSFFLHSHPEYIVSLFDTSMVL